MIVPMLCQLNGKPGAPAAAQTNVRMKRYRAQGDAIQCCSRQRPPHVPKLLGACHLAEACRHCAEPNSYICSTHKNLGCSVDAKQHMAILPICCGGSLDQS